MKIDNFFDKLHNTRKKFLKDNSNLDHVILSGENNILISAPHGVSQVRLGRLKFKEIGSITTALYLYNNTDCYLIAKTKNNNDDANFDNISRYKNSIKDLIKNNNIKYIIDIHGLSDKREFDINLGTHLGKNIEINPAVFNILQSDLKENGFSVSIDQPFMAGSNTISGSLKNEFQYIWTLQVEINSRITNKKENFIRYSLLLDLLINWIKFIGA